MTIARWGFLLPAILLPASFLGLSLYYLVVTPSKDDFFVGPVGALTGTLLLIDGILALIGLAAFCYLLLFSPTERRALWIIVAFSAVAMAATYSMAMQVLRMGYGVAN